MISFPNNIGGANDFQIMVGQVGELYACALLDIHRTTLRRLLKPDGKVPKVYLMALYWETSWGRSVIDSDHQAERQNLFFKTSFLQQENARLAGIIAEMDRLMDFGTANAPALEVTPVR